MASIATQQQNMWIAQITTFSQLKESHQTRALNSASFIFGKVTEFYGSYTSLQTVHTHIMWIQDENHPQEDATNLQDLIVYSGNPKRTMPVQASHPTEYAPFVYMGSHQEVPLNVTNVLIHASVKVIPRGAFEGCHRLKQVEFQEGVEVIGDSAFCNCTSLELVHLASTVQTIGTAAFAFCLSLQQVDLNPGLVKIGCAAFCGCISLEIAKVPSTVLIVREGAFLNCMRLQKVVLASGVTTIGNLAFANCDLRECPTLPETVSSIGYQALPSAHDDHDDEQDCATPNQSDKQCLDHVKLNARRELEIHTLQDQLEQIKLENAQLLVQLETISKERDELQNKLLLKARSNNEQPSCQEDGLFLSSKVKEETLSILDQDLAVTQSTIHSSKNTAKSCWKDVVHLLQAPVRLSMNKFAELDAYMAAHNQMMEQQQQRFRCQVGLERSFQELQEVKEGHDTMAGIEAVSDDLVVLESLLESIDNQASQSHEETQQDVESSLESVDNHDVQAVTSLLLLEEEPISFEIVNAEGNDNDDNDEEGWIADADAFDIY